MKSVNKSTWKPATSMTRTLEIYNWFANKTEARWVNSDFFKSLTHNPKTVGIQKRLLNYEYWDKSKKWSLIESTDWFKKLFSVIEKKIGNLKSPPDYEKKIREKHTWIVNLYLKALEEFLSQEGKKIKDSDTQEIFKSGNFHKALIACCFGVIFLVNNASGISFCQTSWYLQCWGFRIVENYC